VIAELLVWPLGVVPFNPRGNGSSGFGEVAEVTLPYTLLLEATKKPLDDSVGFGRQMRRNGALRSELSE
jgi:hypothetical protein